VFQYPPYDLALASKMAEVIDREKLDILHVHYAMPHAISAILAKQIAERDVKIVTTLHGTDITVLGIDNTFKEMIKYGIEQSDGVGPRYLELVTHTIAYVILHSDSGPIHKVLHENGRSRKDFQDRKQQDGIHAEEIAAIHISNLRRRKRVEHVIYPFEK